MNYKKRTYHESIHKRNYGLPFWKWLWDEENNEALYSEHNNNKQITFWV